MPKKRRLQVSLLRDDQEEAIRAAREASTLQRVRGRGQANSAVPDEIHSPIRRDREASRDVHTRESEVGGVLNRAEAGDTRLELSQEDIDALGPSRLNGVGGWKIGRESVARHVDVARAI